VAREQTLKIAGEVALALDKAHCRGTIHRDSKPGYNKLKKSGARLLDFRLAKTPAPLFSGVTRPTAAMPKTPAA
jgi:serine/threonine protein kinase